MSSVLASTTAATPSTDLDPRPRRWTREEFYRMAELGWFHGQRVELIEGEIMVLRVCSKSLCCGPSPWSLVPKPIPVLRPGQPTEHQLNHADPDLRLAGISQVFIILAVNPAPTQPAEGSLHHPPPRQQLKPSVPGRSADDLNHIPPVLRDPSVQGVIVVLGVRPQLPQARERFARQLAEDLRCRRRIIHGRTGHGHG